MNWLLLAVVGLLIASALFVAAEFSLVAARRTQIEPLASTSSRARATLTAMGDVSVMMASAQLGITVCGILLGAVGEPAIAHLVRPGLVAAGLPPAATGPAGLVIALVLVAAAHVAFGEMVPKNIALAAPERVALALVPLLQALTRMIGPVVRGLNHVANAVVRLLGLHPKAEVASTFTRDEVAGLVAQSADEGLLDPEDLQLIGSALGFDTTTVADVLLRDDELVTVGPRPTPAEVERACARTGFSRFPVVGEERNGTLTGFVHVRDALRVLPERREEPLPRELIRRLPVIPPGTPLRTAADLMRSQGAHMARVAGGGGAGILMLEDALEVLVGQVADATRRSSGPAAFRPAEDPSASSGSGAADRRG